MYTMATNNCYKNILVKIKIFRSGIQIRIKILVRIWFFCPVQSTTKLITYSETCTCLVGD